MNDRPLLHPWPLLALLCACPLEGTLGVYRTDAATLVAATTDPTTTTDTPTTGDLSACELTTTGACSECLRAACCDALPACTDPPGCNCMFTCITAGTPARDCVDMCTPDAHTKEFSQCAMKYCADTCEGAAP